MMFLTSIVGTIGGICVIYAFKFGIEAQINIGLVSAIFALQPGLVSVVFYILFKE